MIRHGLASFCHMTKELSHDKIFVNSSRPMNNILGAQMRAARALLRWAAADLVREFRGQSRYHSPCGNGRREDGDDLCQRICHSQGS